MLVSLFRKLCGSRDETRKQGQTARKDIPKRAFEVAHFRQLVTEDVLLRGGFVAEPWLIARARVVGGCVVTEEKKKPNAAKIPNVCEHFSTDFCNIEGLFEREGWRY